MARLSQYLLKLFASEALALFGVAAFLLFLIQCLRLFDIVSDKGQGLLTLVGQAVLGMPSLAILFLYICLGIGLGRSLRNLQASTELTIIHTNGLVPAMFRAIGLYGLIGAAFLLFLAHVVDPVGQRTANQWTAGIAADLVSRSLVPHKFVEIVPGVTMVIGARDAQGNISDFFADDRRDPVTRRTYFAGEAVLNRDEEGFVLRLRGGAVQYVNASERLSEIAFDNYDLALDSLTGSVGVSGGIAETSSLDLVSDALATGTWTDGAVTALYQRSGEGLRVLAMVLFVAAFAAFPTGKRQRFEAPIELVVLGAAFLERAVTSYVPGGGWMQLGTGAMLLAIIGAIVLAFRLRLFAPTRRRQPA